MNSPKINLGNGAGFSVKEVSEVFKKVTGKDFKISRGKRRAGDPDLVISNNKFAKEYLGWEPRFIKIEEHVEHTWKWYQKNKHSL